MTHVKAKQEQELEPPVVVSAGSSIDVTMRVDLGTWFLDAARTGLVNPATAGPGQPNERLVVHNIKSSFNAFQHEDEHHERRGS